MKISYGMFKTWGEAKALGRTFKKIENIYNHIIKGFDILIQPYYEKLKHLSQ